MSALLASVALASAAFSATYDCVLEAPKALNQDGAQVSLNAIQFPGVAEGAWKFRINVTRNEKGVNGDIIWPGNPIQIAGKFPGLPTADGSIALTAYSMGPCTFTESGCMSVVSLVDFGDGTAKVIVMPTALATDSEKKTREPFVVVIEGKCTRIGSPK
ncbi:hypothetical protein OK349_05335 [Sphingomonas sp. BT-65]|uniref:hypothetical protein n=1 Tax=Sphingomonas sp. BT-65 TaxID=2989821 RepID=UPI002235604D|nr:hypothetical protein [Sphingomonas sp. BT-65]MCW4461122.1 hypothetical protein [Sphingomonas sp. BT-65]